MVNLKINGKPVCVKEGTTLLDAAKSVGIDIPTLCYLKDVNEIGACRVCVVEIVGNERLASSCNTAAQEGMEVLTDSRKVIDARRSNVKLILSQHDDRCPSCVRNGNCSLQTVAKNLGITEVGFDKKFFKDDFPKDFPLVRDVNKCIKCMRCVSVCEKVQSLAIWDGEGMGSRTTVGVRGGKSLTSSDCSLCGQCITHCPCGALHERDDTDKVADALRDPETVTVFQIAPAVRAAWGEEFNLTPEFATAERLVYALKKAGADYVFDTDFAADLTIMEEGNELLERLPEIEETRLPMFTSCCPGWVRFMKAKYPGYVARLSTAKSPQQMFGSVAKSYFAEKIGVPREKIFCVSVMPCVAKKYESSVKALSENGVQDVDVALTTREAARLIRTLGIDPLKLAEENFDSPLGTATGAGVIFGATGGVMEAALRSAYFFATKTLPDPDAFTKVMDKDGYKEATFNVGEKAIKIAVCHGLKNAEKLMENIKSGKEHYHFVEVMACPGGCSGGGGQPIHDGKELAFDRAKVLCSLDKNAKLRFSHENPSIIKLYDEYLGAPLSEKAHHLLHTDQTAWER